MEPHVDFDYDLLDAPLSRVRATEHELYREVSIKFVRALHLALAMCDRPAERWGVRFATADPSCKGRSIADVAAQIGVTRAAISRAARAYCGRTGLPPSSYMRKEEAAQLASKIRNAYVEKQTKQQRK